MKDKVIYVIDPTYEDSIASDLEHIHAEAVDKIQDALAKCISELFEGWNVHWTSFIKNYIKPLIKCTNRYAICTEHV